MKILFIHNTLPEYRLKFFRELSAMVDLDLLITDKKLAYKIYGLPMSSTSDFNIKYLENVLEIVDILSNCYYDIVVLPPVDTPFQWLCAYFAYKTCQRKNIKTIYWTEKWEPEKSRQPILKRIKNFIQKRMIGFFSLRVDRCICAGSRSQNYLNGLGVSKDKITVAYDSSTSTVNNQGKLNIRKMFNIPLSSKIILFLGRMIARKGCLDLLKAFALLKSACPETFLLIGGDGPELTKCKKYISEEGVSNVIFCGQISPNVRAEYFKQADVFVLPSFTLNGVIEAWGLTVNEALEQGTPVIATTAVGAAYDLADGKNCVMVREHDVKELANAIIRVLGLDKNVVSCKSIYNSYSVYRMAFSFKDAFNLTLIKN